MPTKLTNNNILIIQPKNPTCLLSNTEKSMFVNVAVATIVPTVLKGIKYMSSIILFISFKSLSVLEKFSILDFDFLYKPNKKPTDLLLFKTNLISSSFLSPQFIIE